ncbi:MAG: glycosyltransferase [Coleofasciculaceae cyanobacterium]
MPEIEPLPTSTSTQVSRFIVTPRQVEASLVPATKAEILASIFEPTNNSYNFVDWAKKPMVVTPPSASCELCVIVPVRDEAENLTATLDALAHQIDLNGQPLKRDRYEIILLANNCSDDSAASARNFAALHPTLALHVVEMTLPPNEAYIGRVRRILMEEAYQRLASLGRPKGVIASTDGDTKVASNWIAAILDEIASGADAVGGRILTDRTSRLQLDRNAYAYHLRHVGYRFLVTELESYLDPEDFDPFPRHFQYYGASLAVTVEMYKQVGGMPAVRSPEDAAFNQSLLRFDARIRHSPNVRVMTSARQNGRVDVGMAAQLSQWAAMGRNHQPDLVESPQAIASRFHRRRALRQLWHKFKLGNNRRSYYRNIAVVAKQFGVSQNWLTAELQTTPTFGLLYEQIEKYSTKSDCQLVEIEQAISELRLYLQDLRQASAKSHFLKQVKPIFCFATTA